jgi:hypothetical protein
MDARHRERVLAPSSIVQTTTSVYAAGGMLA